MKTAILKLLAVPGVTEFVRGNFYLTKRGRDKLEARGYTAKQINEMLKNSMYIED